MEEEKSTFDTDFTENTNAQEQSNAQQDSNADNGQAQEAFEGQNVDDETKTQALIAQMLHEDEQLRAQQKAYKRIEQQHQFDIQAQNQQQLQQQNPYQQQAPTQQQVVQPPSDELTSEQLALKLQNEEYAYVMQQQQLEAQQQYLESQSQQQSLPNNPYGNQNNQKQEKSSKQQLQASVKKAENFMKGLVNKIDSSIDKAAESILNVNNPQAQQKDQIEKEEQKAQVQQKTAYKPYKWKEGVYEDIIFNYAELRQKHPKFSEPHIGSEIQSKVVDSNNPLIDFDCDGDFSQQYEEPAVQEKKKETVREKADKFLSKIGL